MSRPSLLIALSLALAPGLLCAQEATTVYKTKNADGTSVYTQIESQGAESRRIDGKDPVVAAAADATPKTETQIACERARGNLALLDSGKVLQRDKDGDGTPEDLTAEELAKERDLATRQAAAYCADPES